MSDFLQKIENTIASRKLIPLRSDILVAVSGGLDSMVLLHALARLAAKHHWRITVAHFNHRLRGRTSDADERLVRKTAEKLQLPFVSDSADVRNYSRTRKVSIEMAARELRHSFLARVARKRGIQFIALAHHADDQVELFFLRLLRGSGGEALAGMKWKNPSPQNPNVTLVRPLLDRTKSELTAWAKQEGIAFREDASNSEVHFQRNRIRHELLPLLKKHYQPALENVVLRQMDVLGAESGLVTNLAQAWLKSNPRKSFDSLPIALQRRCLQLQLTGKGIATNFDLIERLRESAGQIVTVSPSLFIFRDEAGQICVPETTETAFDSAETKLSLQGRAGELAIDDFRLKWKVLMARGGTFRAPKKRVNYEYFDAEKVGKTVVLRHWRPGDRFQPIGMPKPVKLQDLFTNQKVLRSRRRGLMVCASADGDLFWVEGLRIGERFKLDKSTLHRLKWQWNRV